MASIDQFLLALLIGIPLVSAAFVVLVPHFDVASVRQITTTVLIVWFLILLRCGYLLFHKGQVISFEFDIGMWLVNNSQTGFRMRADEWLMLLGLWCALFSVFYLNERSAEENGLSFHVVTSLLFATVTAAILADSVAVTIIVAHVSVLLTLYVVAHFGGSSRGSASFHSAIFFLATDVLALLTFFWLETEWSQSDEIFIYLLVLVPGLSRLLVPFFAPFSRGLFANCPSEILTLCIGTMIPMGAILLIRTQQTLPSTITLQTMTPIVEGTALFSAFFSALWALREKDLRQLCVALLMFQSSLFVAMVLLSRGVKSSFFQTLVIFSGVVCASFMLFASKLVSHDAEQDERSPHVQQLWLASLILFIPVPGLGTGTPIWRSLMHLFSNSTWQNVYVVPWSIALLIYTTALAQHACPHLIRLHTFTPVVESAPIVSDYLSRAWISFVVVLLLCIGASMSFIPVGG